MMRLRGLGILWALMALVLGCFACSQTEQADSATQTGTEQPQVEAPSAKAEATVPEGAGRLLKTYPDHIKDYVDGNLVMADGTKIVYDSGKEKSFLDKLDHAEPVDIFAWTYDTTSTQPGYCEDPGRSRCEQLFKLMYGASSAQVQKHLVPVDWFGTKVMFSSVNGAADSLRAVSLEIKNNPHLLAYTKTAGTFYWRKVSGSERLSAHSYGIAIDVGVSKSNYWKWDNPGKNETATIKYKNNMPLELVRIFERHGFIWGGRWYHYDTMHFEFRPELLM